MGFKNVPCCILRTKTDAFRQAHVTNADIYKRSGQIPVSEMVQCRRLQLFGHVEHCDAEQNHARARRLDRGSPEKLEDAVGHPSQTWLRVVTSDLLL